MNANYDEATSRPAAGPSQIFSHEITRDDLLQLLLYMERELVRRDKTIEALKEEKSKLMLLYARVCPDDPIHALSRDSELVPEVQPQSSIGELLNNQAATLEVVCDRFNATYQRTLHVAHSLQHRIDIAMHDLELERKWKNEAVSKEAMLSLKEENERLKEEIKRSNKAVALVKQEIDEAESKRQAESERHKKGIIFLMNERKELLLQFSELQFRKNSATTFEQKTLIDDLRKQVESLISDRDSLKSLNRTMKGEMLTLQEVTRVQEEEMYLLKKNLTRTPAEKNMDDGSVVMTNRIAMSAPTRNLSSSSSFPSDKSRLPRAPVTSPSTNPSQSSKTMIVKKTPAMGVSTMRRTVERRGIGGDDASKLVRSSSLRGQSEPRPLGPSISSIRPSTLPKSPSNGANVSPVSSPSSSSTPSRLPFKIDGKTANVKTKNSILRAFGK